MKETSWARPSLLSGFTLPLEYAFKFCLQHLTACLVQSSKVFHIPQKNNMVKCSSETALLSDTSFSVALKIIPWLKATYLGL